MSFGTPAWFWGLFVIPVLALLFLRSENRAAQRLHQFVSPRLLPQLAGNVNRFRRVLRFSFQMLGIVFAIISLAQPRWGYVYEDVKRKGLDLLIGVDTSRSMLSNDVQPNRLERVKLATQDLINQLQGDRIGLIAFAGRAFLQAPLTIDYQAAAESINDLDTKTIPEGGTNISEAIDLAVSTFGKSATGNRALILFTDGEELSGDAAKAAKAASNAGVRIFTIGVGTPQGSLIPITSDTGSTAFVKDSSGQVVKSKLDEQRLREIAKATGGFYLHLENGPRTMSQLYSEGLSQMKAAELDARLSRRPVERYEWPLGAALLALSLSILVGERKRLREKSRLPRLGRVAIPAAALLLLLARSVDATVPGLNFYREGKYADAYRSFQDDLAGHPDSPEKSKIEFDSGAAAFKMGDYTKALESFSGALLSNDKSLQENSHFNLGRTLEDRADMDKTTEVALKDLTDAESHYEAALKLNPNNEAAKANLEAVKKKIERLKQHPKQRPTPPPQQQENKKQKQQQSGGDQNQNDQQSQSQSSAGKDQKQQQNQQQENQQNQAQQQQQQNQQQQQTQSRNNSKDGRSQKPENKQKEAMAKNEAQKKQQPQPGERPSPSPGADQNQPNQPSPTPGADKNDKQNPGPGESPEQSPTPGNGEDQTPSPSPGEGEGEGGNATPWATPGGSPPKKFAGEIKGANGKNQPQSEEKAAQLAEAELEKNGQMTEKQALSLLQSMKDEEQRVQLDERRATRHVYNDW